MILVRLPGADVRLRCVVEHCVELVELLLADGIVLVIVALGASEGESHPDRAGCADPVDLRFAAKLLAIRTVFMVHQGVPVKPCSCFLFCSCVGEKVTAKLFDREGVEWLITIDRTNHPISIDVGGGTGAIELESATVSVACQVQPMTSPPFAEVGGSEQRINESFVSQWVGIVDERFYFVWFWGKTNQIEIETSDECLAIGLR